MIVHIDTFTTLDDLKGKNLTYENLKALALKAGRFSVFDASDMKRAKLLDRLCRDPEIQTDHVNFAFPWIGVRTKPDV